MSKAKPTVWCVHSFSALSYDQKLAQWVKTLIWRIIYILEIIYKVKRRVKVHHAEVLKEVGATLCYIKRFLWLNQMGENIFSPERSTFHFLISNSHKPKSKIQKSKTRTFPFICRGGVQIMSSHIGFRRLWQMNVCVVFMLFKGCCEIKTSCLQTSFSTFCDKQVLHVFFSLQKEKNTCMVQNLIAYSKNTAGNVNET